MSAYLCVLDEINNNDSMILDICDSTLASSTFPLVS